MAQESNTTILTYKGVLTFDIMEDILFKSKAELDAMQLELVVKKRVYSVLVECLENTYRHNSYKKKQLKHSQVELVLEKSKSNIIVAISNYVDKENLDELTAKIDKVNSMELDALNQLYRTAISKARISEKGGAGLGIIEIARNSRQKMAYQTITEVDNVVHFSLKVSIAMSLQKKCHNGTITY